MRMQASSSPQQGKAWSRTGRIFAITIGLVVALGAGTWLMGAAARSRLAAQHPAPGWLVDVGGYRMHISCAGEEQLTEEHPTVVLDAGLLDFSTQWARVMPAAARFTRVCAYDRAGLGWSEPSPYPRTSAAMVEELRALLSGADLDPPYILVGHSFGGMNARLYAHRYPEEVAGVVLVDATHEEQSLRIEALREAAGQTAHQFRTLARLSALGFLALSPERIPDRGLPDEAAAQYRAVLAATDYFGAASSELCRSAFGRQITVEQSGHDIHLQQPQLVVAAIREMTEMVSW